MGDILLIVKKIFLQIISKISNNNFDNNNFNNNADITFVNIIKGDGNNNNNFTERFDYKIPIKLIDAFCSFISLVSNLISRIKLDSEFRFLNETFLSCSTWLNVLKFMFDYLLVSNLGRYMNNINLKMDKSASNTQIY